jgi:hypothetical protein
VIDQRRVLDDIFRDQDENDPEEEACEQRASRMAPLD